LLPSIIIGLYLPAGALPCWQALPRWGRLRGGGRAERLHNSWPAARIRGMQPASCSASEAAFDKVTRHLVPPLANRQWQESPTVQAVHAACCAAGPDTSSPSSALHHDLQHPPRSQQRSSVSASLTSRGSCFPGHGVDLRRWRLPQASSATSALAPLGLTGRPGGSTTASVAGALARAPAGAPAGAPEGPAAGASAGSPAAASTRGARQDVAAAPARAGFPPPKRGRSWSSVLDGGGCGALCTAGPAPLAWVQPMARRLAVTRRR